jgi:predicted DNA-binding antitoxin AbrB/MazE fold protein
MTQFQDGDEGIRLRVGNATAIPARYENGIFRPLEEVAIEEGTVVEVHVPAESESPQGRRSIKDLAFYGLWAGRDDITYGSAT